jgi:hypothetical protein
MLKHFRQESFRDMYVLSFPNWSKADLFSQSACLQRRRTVTVNRCDNPECSNAYQVRGDFSYHGRGRFGKLLAERDEDDEELDCGRESDESLMAMMSGARVAWRTDRWVDGIDAPAVVPHVMQPPMSQYLVHHSVVPAILEL